MGDAEHSTFPCHISCLRRGEGPTDMVHEKSDS
jgi:hypothetical protein